MQIDRDTLLFTNIDPSTRAQMVRYAKALVLSGAITHPEPSWVTEWRAYCGFEDPSKWLLVVSTVLPQRILLSLLLEEPRKG